MNRRINPLKVGGTALCALFAFPGNGLAFDSICPDYRHYDGVLKQGESKVDSGSSFRRPSADLYLSPRGFFLHSRIDGNPSIHEFENKEAFKRKLIELSKVGNLIDKNKPSKAFNALERLFNEVPELNMANRLILKDCNKNIDKLIAKFKGDKKTEPILSKAHALQAKCKKRIMKIECLDMAKKLSTTGFKLEKQGDAGEASTMYKSAYEIRLKNLSGKDRLIADTLVNLARAEAASENYLDARTHYQKAIDLYKANRIKSDSEYQNALEGYAFLLRKVNQNKLADAVYDEIRNLE